MTKKQVKKKNPQLKFPLFIEYNGLKVYRSDCEFSYACYMLPASYMNKKIYINRNQLPKILQN